MVWAGLQNFVKLSFMSFNLKHVNEYKIYRVPVKFVTNLKRNETERNKMKPIETKPKMETKQS